MGIKFRWRVDSRRTHCKTVKRAAVTKREKEREGEFFFIRNPFVVFHTFLPRPSLSRNGRSSSHSRAPVPSINFAFTSAHPRKMIDISRDPSRLFLGAVLIDAAVPLFRATRLPPLFPPSLFADFFLLLSGRIVNVIGTLKRYAMVNSINGLTAKIIVLINLPFSVKDALRMYARACRYFEIGIEK